MTRTKWLFSIMCGFIVLNMIVTSCSEQRVKSAEIARVEQLTPEQKAQEAAIAAAAAKSKSERNEKIAADEKATADDLLGIACKKENKGHAIIGEHQARTRKCGWGKPQHINRTIRANYEREQWVYGGHNYLYFENGVLTSIQN